MSISLISGLTGTQQQSSLSNASARVQAAIASIVSGDSLTSANDVASLSVASKLQAETAGFRQISGNLAQGSTLAEVADGGAQQIQSILSQLQDLAAQAASPTQNPANRGQIDQQFQSLVAQIDSIVGTTTFSGKKLLDGSVSGDDALSLESLFSISSQSDGAQDLSIGDLSSSSLLGQGLSLLTADQANTAVDAIGQALENITGVRAGIGSFQQTVDYASATIDSAVANHEAARSQLQDSDIAQASTEYAMGDVQRNAGIALQAQGNRLSPSMLLLVS